MKNKVNLFSLFVFIFGTTMSTYSQGYLVPNGVSAGKSGSAFIGFVTQNPANGDYTGFFLNSLGGNNFTFDSFADEGVRVFMLEPESPVSLPAIQSGSYTELTYNPRVYYIFADGSEFYVGLYTGTGYPQNGIYPDPSFGWALLKNDGGTIKLLDSALAYGADGIYAGTRTLINVPEPSTLLLTAIGGALALARRKRNPKPSR